MNSSPAKPAQDPQPVVIAWGLAGAILGMGYSVTARITDGDERGLIWILLTLTLGVLLGFCAHHIERGWSARSGAELMDQRGQVFVPRNGIVYVIPAVLVVPGLLWLGVVSAIHTHSLWAAEGFLLSTLIVVWALWRSWCGYQLRRSLFALSAGRLEEGRSLLRTLVERRFVPQKVKEGASLNLAHLALRSGELSTALSYFEEVRSPNRRAPALVGSALAHALLGRYGGAERRLRDISRLPHAKDYLSQVDEVRLLVLLRRDGPMAAFEFGQRLSSPANGDLFRGLMLVALQRLARDFELANWSDPGLADRLHASGLVDVVSELRELPEVHWNPFGEGNGNV